MSLARANGVEVGAAFALPISAAGGTGLRNGIDVRQPMPAMATNQINLRGDEFSYSVVSRELDMETHSSRDATDVNLKLDVRSISVAL